ncbi:hypothetical protein QE152_g7375 [Popillia japonica]|uniref:Uncharacterized protein n=1 Tax=Popillia japonica TaxID=7064 RepID=A0AAW1MFL1_POPJA
MLSKNSEESLVFAIKSLGKLVTKYYGKSDYSNLIHMQKYQYAILRKTFESERYSRNSVAAALQTTSPYESDSSSSDGYFSNTSSLEDTVGLKSANLKDFNVLSEKVYSYTNAEKAVSNSDYKNSDKIESNQSSKNLYSYTNAEKAVSNSDYKNSDKIESNQSSKNLSNTKSKTIVKEARIRRKQFF